MIMENWRKIYFLGIGGIGMSALARYFNKRNVHCIGYDKTKTPLTEKLEAEGIQIHYEDRPDLIPIDCDLVIYTPAIPKNLKEFLFVVEKKFDLKKRSEVLGIITNHRKSIAVAGTHGKTSTSILISHILVQTKLGVSAFLGGIAANYKSNYIDQGENIVVLEADEYDRSFLQLKPDLTIINSLDADHLDIYGSREEMVETYLRFARQIKPGGTLLLYEGIAEEEKQKFIQIGVKLIEFGLKGKLRAEIKSWDQKEINFDYCDNENFVIPKLSLPLAGKHNVINAVAAIKACLIAGVKPQNIGQAIASFKGVSRRFELVYSGKNITLIDDYAHHPTELAAAISAAKMHYPDKKITGIFQPHLYSRTRDFMEEFAQVLGALDQLILVEIYPAREEPINGISSNSLFENIILEKKYICLQKELTDLLKTLDLEVVMTLGAGDLDLRLDEIKACLINKYES